MASKEPPIPVAFSDIGLVGHLESRRGFYINSAVRRHLFAMLRDEERAIRLVKEVGVDVKPSDLLAALALGSDRRDAVAMIKSARSALVSWDNFISAKTNGKSMERFYMRQGGGCLAGRWHHMAVSQTAISANPPLVSGGYGAIPGLAISSSTSGALSLPMVPAVGESLYLGDVRGTLNYTGSNDAVVMIADLVYGSNLDAGSLLTQTVNTTNLPRYTGGAGLKVAIQFSSASARTATVTYINQSGGGSSMTGTNIGTANNGFSMLTPDTTATAYSPWFQFQAGDYGVQNISTVTYSATGAPVISDAILIYKPLLMYRQLVGFAQFERSLPLQMGYDIPIGDASSKAFISVFADVQTTANISPSMLFEVFWG